MSKQREALELAQKAIAAIELTDDFELTVKASRAIREALAEPEPWTPDDMAYRPGGLSMSAEQEPVAWMMVNEEHGHKPTLHWKPQEDWNITWKAVPLYATPPARKPLTDEEINALELPPSGCNFRDIVRVIERAHGIGAAFTNTHNR